MDINRESKINFKRTSQTAMDRHSDGRTSICKYPVQDSPRWETSVETPD